MKYQTKAACNGGQDTYDNHELLSFVGHAPPFLLFGFYCCRTAEYPLKRRRVIEKPNQSVEIRKSTKVSANMSTPRTDGMSKS
jgi:hypothetical protein